MLFLRRRYLRVLADAICRRPKIFLVAGLLLAAGAVLFTVLRLDFRTSRNDLIGRDSEYWRLYSEYAREFRAEEDYIIVVESPQPARNRAAVDSIVAALLAPANNPAPGDPPTAQFFAADDLFYRVDLEALKQWFLYYLEEGELQQIRDSLTDFNQLVAILQQNPKLHTFVEAMNEMLGQMATAPASHRQAMQEFLPTVTGILQQLQTFDGADETWRLLSPWARAFFDDEKLRTAEAEMRWQGYQTFRDGHMYVILIHPQAGGSAGSVRHETSIPKIRRILAAVQPAFSDVTINLTGEPVLDVDEMLVSERDSTRATILTLAVCAVIFMVGFREWLRPVLATVCMLLIVAASLGWATVSVGHLNIITVTFTVMIIGLGIDFSIQWLARYEEELSRGATRPEAVHTAIERTGISIITAGVTNAAAFFAMGLSGFRGVIELGIIAGGGILLAVIITVVVLPALVLLVHREGESTHIPAQAQAGRAEAVLLRRPYLVLTICAVITAGALLVGWRMKFDYNVLNLQSKSLPSVQTELRLISADVESTLFAAVVCDSFADAYAVHHRLAALPTVATVHSIAELIPEKQEQKAPIIQAIRERLGTIEFKVVAPDAADLDLLGRRLSTMRLRANQLARAATERGDSAAAGVLNELAEAAQTARASLLAGDRESLTRHLGEYEARFYSDLQTQLTLLAGQAERPMTLADVPDNIRRMLVGKNGKFLVRVFARENIWEREPLVRFVRDVQTVAPQVTGTPLGIFEFVELLMRGYRNAALWALLVIALVIFVDFRGLVAMGFTIIPLLVGTAWMLGAMAVLQIQFNPANIMTLPLIVGIGVAYGIYVVQRYRETGEATFWGKSTGRAVILSALTTIVAFASLTIGDHRGIRSLGLVMAIGVAACLVASMTLLPALLEIARRRGWKV